MIGAEARATGHNTMLSGGVNLAREPRNGRNFEYVGEDPLLAGTMAGALIDGIQSNRIISTIKHYAVNDQETLRTSLDVTISADAMRQSDLLAFELAIEKGSPGSVMCSYNLINGRWGCENDYLLNTVLKGDWGYQGLRDERLGRGPFDRRRRQRRARPVHRLLLRRRQAVVRAAGDEGGAAIGRDPAGAARRHGRAHPVGAVRQGRRSTIR